MRDWAKVSAGITSPLYALTGRGLKKLAINSPSKLGNLEGVFGPFECGKARDKEGTGIGLQAVSRGQEFVLDGRRHPAVYKYFVDRIKTTSAKVHRCSHGS
jgi:hypothetical protein